MFGTVITPWDVFRLAEKLTDAVELEVACPTV